MKVPADWKSGYYTARLTANPAEGKTATTELFFVVLSANPGKDTKILLQLSTNTYNAYTNWGGYSLYAYHGKNRVQGSRVSFDRPQYSQFYNWELPFVLSDDGSGFVLIVPDRADIDTGLLSLIHAFAP